MSVNEKQIRWRCRRGMKELDVLFERFLAGHFHALDETGRESFARLLDEKDPDLYGWLLGRDEPTDADLRHVIRLVRAAVVDPS